MTRRALFATLPAAAVGQPAGVEIQYRTFAAPPGVGIPEASAALTQFGVLVDIYSPAAAVEAYSVALRVSSQGTGMEAEQVKCVARQRGDVRDGWTSVAFWTGEPVDVRRVTVRALVCAEAREI